MGIFDNDTETYAYMGSSAVLEPENYINSVKSNIVSGARHEDEEIPRNILLALKAGFNFAVDKFIDYGYEKYIYTPPIEYELGVRNQIDEIKKRIVEEINAKEGAGLTEDDILVKEERYGNFANTYLSNTTANITGKVTPRPYVYWYMQNQMNLIEPTGPLDLWVPEYDRVKFQYSDSTSPLLVNEDIVIVRIGDAFFNDYSVRTTFLVDTTTVTYHSIPAINPPHKSAYWIAYNRTDDPLINGQKPTRYWYYIIDSNEYPEIKEKYYEGKRIETWMPVVFFMLDKEPWDKKESSAWYTTNLGIMDTLGMDAHEVWENFKDVDSQDAEKWDMYVHFGCPINRSPDAKDRQVVQEYLYYLFLDFSNRSKTSFYLKLGDSRGYNNGYDWSSVDHTDYGIHRPPNFGDWEAVNWTEGDDPKTPFFNFSVWAAIPDTKRGVYFYKKIRVNRFNQSILTNTSDGFRLAYAPDWDNLYMEVNVRLLDQIKLLYKERFYQACLRGTVVLVEEVDIPWYQSGFWKAVFAVIVIIVAIVLTRVEIVGWAVTIFGATISLQALIVKVTFGFLLSFTAGYVYGDTLGGAFALLLVVSVIMSGGIGGFFSQFNLSNILNQGFGTAVQGLKSVTQLLNIGAKYYTQEKLEELQAEYEAFVETYKEEQERLEAYYYGFVEDSTGQLDPIVDIVAKGNDYIYESPEAFLERTTQTNPGSNMMELVPNFTKVCTRLPKDTNITNPLDGIIQMISGPTTDKR